MSGLQNSMTGFLTNLNTRPKAALQLLNRRPETYATKTVENGDKKYVVLQANQAEMCVESVYDQRYSADSYANNILTDGGVIQVKINPKQLSFVRECTLALTINNPDPSNTITFCSAYQLIDHIDVNMNNGALIETLYGDSLFIENVFRPSQTAAALNSVNNLNASYAGTTAIATSSSITYLIPLSSIHFAKLDMYMPAIAGDIYLQIYLRPASITREAGTSTTYSLTACQVWCRCTDLTPEERDALAKKYQSQPHTFRFVRTIKQGGQSTAWSAGVQTQNFSLDMVKGLCCWVFGLLRASPTTGTALRTIASAIDSYHIKNSGGASLFGGNAVPFQYMNKNIGSDLFPLSNFLQTIPLIYYTFTKQPMEIYETNKPCGFTVLSGDENIDITTTSSFGSGNYILDLFFGVFSVLTIGVDGSILRADS